VLGSSHHCVLVALPCTSLCIELICLALVGLFAKDVDELAASDLHAALAEMARKQRFRQLLLVLDTCEAQSMFVQQEFNVPGVIAVGSSSLGENSYAHGIDEEVGVIRS
jgi:glycosylphosphatidylinositol transamidase (GPIT) subunit GPI8